MKRLLSLIALAAVTVLPNAANANGFAHSPEYIGKVNRDSFKGRKPEEIAWYLTHFSGGVAAGAVEALAAGGEKNLPLVKKLLKDTNPWIRSGAVQVLTGMYAPPQPKKGHAEAPEMTPQLKAAGDLVKTMLKDKHPAVQRSIGGFFSRVRIENEYVHKILITQAADVDPSVRSRTAAAIRRWIKDQPTRIRVAMEVLSRPDGVSPHSLSMSSGYLVENKDLAKPAIPVIVRFLNDKAHTARGFFTNGPYQRGLALIEHHFDPKLEKTPGLVQAVCRSVVRIPWSNYGGWMDARKRAIAIIERFSPSSAGAVRAAAAEEIKWLKSLTDDEVRAITPADKNQDARAECLKRIKYLQDVSAWLAANKPESKKPPFTHPAPKQKKKKTKK
jgi:HEAT repeat protein